MGSSLLYGDPPYLETPFIGPLLAIVKLLLSQKCHFFLLTNIGRKLNIDLVHLKQVTCSTTPRPTHHAYS